MPNILGKNKPLLLKQVGNRVNITMLELKKLVDTYEDLEVEDFRGHVDDLIYQQLVDALRDPRELELWRKIETAPSDDEGQMQEVIRLCKQYLQYYPEAKEASRAQQLLNVTQMNLDNLMAANQAKAAERQKEEELRRQREAEEQRMREEEDRRRKAQEAAMAREQQEWERLDRGNYSSMKNYILRYPDSIHLDELEDTMWRVTWSKMSVPNLNRYLNDWPQGKYAETARTAIKELPLWQELKRSRDIMQVNEYIINHPDSPFAQEVNDLLCNLQDNMYDEMANNPGEFSTAQIDYLIEHEIFSKYDFIDHGLMTEKSWDVMHTDRSMFPDIQQYQSVNPYLTAPENCTDIYFFGTPGTGKTCLLMGLTGANGHGYTLNMKAAGGPYAAVLQQYALAGITPGHTFGPYVTAINGQVQEERKGKIINHPINLIEMSGEEFAIRIADGEGVSLENMGTGATNLMMNNNRKVFFIIVDSVKDMIPFTYIEEVKDNEGNVIDTRVRKRYISQLEILSKFISLFTDPANAEVMKRVDAIHFIVTKADMLGNIGERGVKARDLLLERFIAPVEMLKNYCRVTKRVNKATNYSPRVFTFSLGRFFVGDVFEFDPAETIQIVSTIRDITVGSREKSFWDKVKEAIG